MHSFPLRIPLSLNSAANANAIVRLLRRRPLRSRARVIDPCTQLVVGARLYADKYAGTRATLLARCVLSGFAFATAERAVTPDGMEPGQCRGLTATHGPRWGGV